MDALNGTHRQLWSPFGRRPNPIPSVGGAATAEPLSNAIESPPIHAIRPEHSARVLVVDDDLRILNLVGNGLANAGYHVDTVANGTAALAAVSASLFDLVLADIYLPDMSGFELFTQLRMAAPEMPVVMLTGFADPDIARQALRVGASDFLAKPCKMSDILAVVDRNIPHMAGRASLSPHGAVASHVREAVLDALLTALDVRDTETDGHSERVTAYTMLLADRLNLGRQEVYHIERGALLHDIGRIAVPERTFTKPGPLSEEEWREIRKHPAVGFKMCQNVDFLRSAAQIVLHHHERWDGKGYPDGLKGDMIPVGARIFAVADALDALTTDRPWRRAVPFDYAHREIVRNAGAQFDPDVVAAFEAVSFERWEAARAQA